MVGFVNGSPIHIQNHRDGGTIIIMIFMSQV